MVIIETLRGPALTNLPAVIKPTLTEFKNLTRVEIWKSTSAEHQSFEYRLFCAQQSAPGIRIRYSGTH